MAGRQHIPEHHDHPSRRPHQLPGEPATRDQVRALSALQRSRSHNEAMDIELLTIPDCPHSHSARELFATALELEGIDPVPLTVTEITTDADAATASFHGSPSFIIDGDDLFPSNAALALTCRVYPSQHGLSGLPDLASLRTAIRGVGARGRPQI